MKQLMRRLRCKHYELDSEEKAKCDEMWESYWNSLTPKQQADEKAYQKHMRKNAPKEKNPIPRRCLECKHIKNGKGHPGEHMTYCEKTGKTFDYWFNESEVR